MSPIIGGVPITSMVFVTQEATKAKLKRDAPGMSHTHQSLLAGAFSGFTRLFVYVPMDLLKSRAQM